MTTNPTLAKTERDPLPDLLKGIAVLMMIQVHLTELFASQEVYDSLFGRISLFFGGVPAAPVFMCTMGWFAMRNKPLLTELKRSLVLLLTAFLLNVSLNLNLLLHIYHGELHADPLSYLFGADILFLASLSLFIVSFLKRIFKDNFWPYLLAAGMVALLTPLLTSPLPAHGVWKYIRPFLADGWAWWSYFPVFPWIAYVFAGMGAAALYRNPPQWKTKVPMPVIVTLLILITAIGAAMGWNTSIHLSQYYHHGGDFFVWSLAVIILWVMLWKRISAFVPELNLLGWLGKNVTAIYFIQWVIIGNLSTWLYKTQSLRALGVWFVTVVLLSISGVLLLRRAGSLLQPKT